MLRGCILGFWGGSEAFVVTLDFPRVGLVCRVLGFRAFGDLCVLIAV